MNDLDPLMQHSSYTVYPVNSDVSGMTSIDRDAHGHAAWTWVLFDFTNDIQLWQPGATSHPVATCSVQLRDTWQHTHMIVHLYYRRRNARLTPLPKAHPAGWEENEKKNVPRTEYRRCLFDGGMGVESLR